MTLFKKGRYDKVLLLAVLALVLVGIVMITSIGVPKSIRISAPELKYADCSNVAVDCYLILKKHVVRAAIGLLGLFVAWKMPSRAWKLLGPLLYASGFILLFYVLIGGDSNNTFAKSWINLPALPFIDSVQPSEIAKLGLIFFLSYFFSEKISFEKIGEFKEGFLKFVLISGLIVVPVALQPDIGSAMIFAFISVVIYYLAGARLRHIAIGALVVMVGVLGLFATSSHIRERVNAFVNPPADCREDYCWQTRQANIAIGSGGFWGKGLTQGIQKSFWLPQAVDDFIFAATSEELGFVRMTIIVLLYAVVAYRGFQIANHAPNKFSMLTAAGISTWISVQAFVNIMVNTALFPITGITLPFMSYGGSSMVMTLFAIGVLLNISQNTTLYEYTSDRRRYGRARDSQPRYSGRYIRI